MRGRSSSAAPQHLTALLVMSPEPEQETQGASSMGMSLNVGCFHDGVTWVVILVCSLGNAIWMCGAGAVAPSMQ